MVMKYNVNGYNITPSSSMRTLQSAQTQAQPQPQGQVNSAARRSLPPGSSFSGGAQGQVAGSRVPPPVQQQNTGIRQNLQQARTRAQGAMTQNVNAATNRGFGMGTAQPLQPKPETPTTQLQDVAPPPQEWVEGPSMFGTSYEINVNTGAMRKKPSVATNTAAYALNSNQQSQQPTPQTQTQSSALTSSGSPQDLINQANQIVESTKNRAGTKVGDRYVDIQEGGSLTVDDVARLMGRPKEDVEAWVAQGGSFGYGHNGEFQYYNPQETEEWRRGFKENQKAATSNLGRGSMGENTADFYEDPHTQAARNIGAQAQDQKMVDDAAQKADEKLKILMEEAQKPTTDWTKADEAFQAQLRDDERRFAEQQARALRASMARGARSGLSVDQQIGAGAQNAQQFGSEAASSAAQKNMQYEMTKLQQQSQDASRMYEVAKMAYMNATSKEAAADAFKMMTIAQQRQADANATMMRMQSDPLGDFFGGLLSLGGTIGGAAIGGYTGGLAQKKNNLEDLSQKLLAEAAADGMTGNLTPQQRQSYNSINLNDPYRRRE